MTAKEKADLLRLAKILVKKIENGDVIAFAAVCAVDTDGGVGTILGGPTKWVRRAFEMGLETLPPDTKPTTN